MSPRTPRTPRTLPKPVTPRTSASRASGAPHTPRPSGRPPSSVGPDRDAVPTVEVDGRIRLGQLLKVADFAHDGAQARVLVQAGDVTVNGVTETRRGHQLADGDLVVVDLPSGPAAVVVRVSGDDPSACDPTLGTAGPQEVSA